jgi:hypothetical protein
LVCAIANPAKALMIAPKHKDVFIDYAAPFNNEGANGA